MIGKNGTGFKLQPFWGISTLKRRYKLTMLLGAILLVGCLFVIFQPGPGYDLQKVHPRLCDLQQPYQTVKTYFFADGGSIGIKIVDRDGHKEWFAIPAHLGDANRYKRVFVGALIDRGPEAVEISDSEHTRRMLICILRDYPDRTPWDDANLTSLRGYPKDYIKLLYHRWCGHFDDGRGIYLY